MSGRRGRVVLAGYPPDLPDLVCVRALDRAIACTLIVGPPALPRDLGNRALLTLDDSRSMRSAGEIWGPVEQALESGEDILRWYPDNPLATTAGRQDAADLHGAGYHIEIVPTVPLEVTGATFAGVPLPDAPRETTIVGTERGDKVEILIDQPDNAAAPTGDLLISSPGTPRQQTGHTFSRQQSSTTVSLSGSATERRIDPNWYESLPLFGKQILVTRTIAQAPVMSRALRNLGAQPVELPAIDIIPDPFPEKTEQAVRDLPDYDWVIFTSVNGVEIFMESVRQNGYDARRFGNARIAAIGTATGERLRRHFIEPDFVPDEFVAEGIISGLRERGIEGRRILIPRAEVARRALPDGLEQSGATVDVVPVYRTIPGTPDPRVLDSLAAGEIDVVTFTSSSTVTNLLAMLGDDPNRLSQSLIACIGPITAETAREHGLDVTVVPDEYSIPGLIDALCTALEEKT